MSDILNFNPSRALDGNVDAVPDARAYFYDTGTTNPRTVYADSALSVPFGTSVEADATGAFPSVFVGGGPVRVIVKSGAGTTISDMDPCVKVPAGGAGASTVSFVPTPEVPATNVQDAIDTVGTNLKAQDDAFDAYKLEVDGFMDAETAIGEALRKAATELAARTALKTGAQFGTSTAIPAAASFDITAIPAWANRVTLFLNGASLTGTDDILIQIGTGTPTTTGYNSIGFIGNTSLGGAGAASTAGFVLFANSAASSLSARFTLHRVTGNTWIADYAGFRSDARGAWGSGAPIALSGALDMIRVSASGANTFDAGTYILSWE